ncbi:MAG TPA: nucleotidyltransferase family protein [Mycobacteriales bacterium]|nr:nucleotidyltransferase family protein [Mycobacteriales bacterium]
MSGPVAGLLLAAGQGRRYGLPKALVPLGGRLLVDRAAAALTDGGCAPTVVVLGASAAEVVARARLDGVRAVVNSDWPTGMGSSLRAGLSALAGTDAVAAVVLLVDTPGIGAEAVRRLASYAAPDAVAVGTYDGRRGHPVLLGRDHWAEVGRRAEGDAGARPFLAAHPELVREVPCEDVADGVDVDVPADLPPA